MKNKLDYIKRSCKTNRQELLNGALAEELEFLRKRCFPHQKKKFLWEDIEIRERRFIQEDKTETLGMYEWDEKEQRHIIYVTKSYIYTTQKLRQAWYRKLYYKKICTVIRHELVHAFVKEQWEYKCKRSITEKNRDGSPIFLGILYFCGGYTGHECLKGFMQTDLYKRIQNNYFKTYRDLHEYLADYIWDFTEAIEQIKKISNEDRFVKQEDKDYFVITNTFEFAPRINGLEKFTEINWMDVFTSNGKVSKHNSINRTWHIGCNVEPKKLIELYNRKQDCKSKYYTNSKQLIILPKCADVTEIDVKDIRTISIKKEKNF